MQIAEAARAEPCPVRRLRIEGGPLLAGLGSCQPAGACSRMATLLRCPRLFCCCCLIASICSKHTAAVRRVVQRRRIASLHLKWLRVGLVLLPPSCNAARAQLAGPVSSLLASEATCMEALSTLLQGEGSSGWPE